MAVCSVSLGWCTVEIEKFSFKIALENEYFQVQSWKKIFVCKVGNILFQPLWVQSGRLAISSCDQHHYLPWLSALSAWDAVLVPLGDTLHLPRNKQVWWCDEMEMISALLMICEGKLTVTMETTQKQHVFPKLFFDLLNCDTSASKFDILSTNCKMFTET